MYNLKTVQSSSHPAYTLFSVAWAYSLALGNHIFYLGNSSFATCAALNCLLPAINSFDRPLKT
ncbi:hypothetical protein CPB83DRAFT_847908 [Crepidotus variabilis]|uniref:Uncharacterized protein n=1 Tax=Crepidotus variabilis TaxID=179855 RepID=A0A9P6EL78_9AGAR|nr:hypothetical protein CPB83DRAFT_847908 [Crepidotus variabilis]